MAYKTAAPLLGTLASWVSGDDATRLAVYQLYDDMYRNAPGTFSVIQRGSDQNVIYLPTAKTIVNACNRFLAKRWDFVVVPAYGTDQEQAELSELMKNTFLREEVYAKFSMQKKNGLIRGDAIWQVTADPSKVPGKRISIHVRHPGSYFPITDPLDDTRVIGCHLADQFDNDGKVVIRRQTYRRDPTTRTVSYESTWWEPGGWDDRPDSDQTLKPATPPEGFAAEPVVVLPAAITSIPVYHVRNDPDETLFGVSELEGFERIIGGLSQAISDEELALALEGLGLYHTTSGPPVDEDGNETNWRIGPGRVVEHDPETTWGRVDGIRDVTPVLDHVAYLDKSIKEASGTPDIAVGKVDQQIAESGISLQLQMSPILSKNAEKEQTVLSVMDHLLYDLSTMWFPVYEGISGQAVAVSLVDDPLPVNRKAFLDEIVLLLTNNIISVEYAQSVISEKLGYEFPSEMMATIVAEQEKLAASRNTDPFTLRVAQELESLGERA